MPNLLELDGRKFAPADQLPIPEWPCVLTERPQPAATLKDDDLFLVTDTLGNISGCLGTDTNSSMGLFCADTRFLSRLELQIEGRSPVLLSSTAEKGFVLSVLCTNPYIEGHLEPDTVGIQRELVLNGGLFEVLKVSNYSTQAVRLELSLSFDADFVDLFEVRGRQRPQRGQLFRSVSDTPENFDQGLTLVYQGLDHAVMESRIQFVHHKPDLLKGNTAVWILELASHETQQFGYRLEMFTNNQPTSQVSAPATLAHAKGAELVEQQTWREQTTRIATDSPSFNQVIQRAEQDVHLLLQSFQGGKQAKLFRQEFPGFLLCLAGMQLFQPPKR